MKKENIQLWKWQIVYNDWKKYSLIRLFGQKFWVKKITPEEKWLWLAAFKAK